MNAEEQALRDAALKHLHEIEAAKQNNRRRFGGLKMPEHIRGDTKLWLALRKLETRIEALEKELKDALQKRA